MLCVVLLVLKAEGEVIKAASLGQYTIYNCTCMPSSSMFLCFYVSMFLCFYVSMYIDYGWFDDNPNRMYRMYIMFPTTTTTS